jgi:hypothetical protein
MSNMLADSIRDLGTSVRAVEESNAVHKLHISNLQERLKERDELVKRLQDQLADAEFLRLRVKGLERNFAELGRRNTFLENQNVELRKQLEDKGVVSLLREVGDLSRELAERNATCALLRGDAARLREQLAAAKERIRSLKTAAFPLLYGNGSRKVTMLVKRRSEKPAGTTTGRVSSAQPSLTELLRTPDAAKVFKKPAYSGLQGHSVGALYPYCVVGVQTPHGTVYRIQNLLTGKWAGYGDDEKRQWLRPAPCSNFIDYILQGHAADDQGEPIIWID